MLLQLFGIVAFIGISQATTNLTSLHHHEKRFLPDIAQLTFPYIPTLLIAPSSTQRLQFIWGVGIPNSLSLESLIFGLVFKAAYFLPTTGVTGFSTQTTTNLFGIGTPNIPGLKTASRKRRSEKYEGEFQVLDEGPIHEKEESVPNIPDESSSQQKKEEHKDDNEGPMTRWHAYTMMEELAKG